MHNDHSIIGTLRHPQHNFESKHFLIPGRGFFRIRYADRDVMVRYFEAYRLSLGSCRANAYGRVSDYGGNRQSSSRS